MTTRFLPGTTARRRWAVAAVAVLCAAVLLLGWWTKARCLLDGAGWQDGEQYTAWCYTDVYALWFAERLDVGAVPYLDHPVEYPVLTGAQMWLAAQVARAVDPGLRAEVFFHVTAVIGAAAALAVLAVLARAGLPPRRLLWWAAAPALATYAFLNWDPVPVLAATVAVVAHTRGRDGLAGVAAGLGTAAKLYPGLLVPVAVVVRLAQRRPRAALLHAGAAAGAWVVVNVPVLLVAPDGWWRFLELNRERPADWDSLWFLAEQLHGGSIPVPVINTWSAVAFLAGAAVIGFLGGRRRDPSRWWELLLPLLAWFLLTNKVYSPQFTLWLLPFAALAMPRAAPYVALLAADLAVFLVRFPFLGGLEGYGPAPGYPWFAAAIVARAAVLVWLIAATVRASPGLLDATSVAGHLPGALGVGGLLGGRRRDRGSGRRGGRRAGGGRR